MTDKDIVICGHGGANPSLKNMYDYCESNYNSWSQNGKRRQLIVVRRPKRLTDELRVKFHDTYKTILGRNVYSQGEKRLYAYKPYKDGKYYSDCSSSGMCTLNEIGINIPVYSTAGIYTSSEFETVPVNIVNGHVTNPEILKVGDCLEFVREDVNRPLQIGHLEYVYEIGGSVPKVTTKDLIKKGQQAASDFTGITNINGKAFDIDGVRGNQTRQMASLVLQTALSKDGHKAYNIKKGDKGYLVTATEILMYMLGKEPNGVEYPGVFGNGLEKAVGSSTVTAEMLLSYLK